MLEVLYHRAKFGGSRISPDAGAAKSVEYLPAALRAAQICRYLVYSEADFEVFRPQGRHVAPMEVKFGKVPSSMPNFTPIGATTKV